jgi:hypothetical protein
MTTDALRLRDASRPASPVDLPLLNLIDKPNPLLAPKGVEVVAPDVINPAVKKRRIPAQRLIQDQRRAASAAAAVADLERDGCELVGLTRGQFSLTELIEAILAKTGPAHLGISTWTAANTSVERMLALMESGEVLSCRWLVDTTFVRRVPALVSQIRRTFGDDAVRVTKTHAKFCTITNEGWQVALRSSMNLNQNPRMESFEVGHDPELCGFLVGVMDQAWEKQSRRLAEASYSDQTRWFNAHG